MCKKCDNPEGNLCNACEGEMQAVKTEALYDDGWWPRLQAGARSINVASTINEAPEVMIYV
jgi:hypothetical protein